ncbi:MAG: PQQ-binding-like beta-propeller repeat protein [Chloroflexi bacterium]|nr:PQQ-binding-like beta-propeller repeat protein [Chloroflexota bacterium]
MTFLANRSHVSRGDGRRNLIAAILAISLIATVACAGGLSPTGGWAAPVITDEGIIVGDKNGDLVRVLPETNSRETLYQGENLKIGKIYGTPLITGTTAYVTAYDCKGNECVANVVGIDLTTRQPLWDRFKQYTPSGQDDAERSDALEAFNAETEVVGGAVLVDDTLIFGTAEIGGEKHPGGHLIALDAKSFPDVPGRVKWVFPTGDAVFSTPVVVDGIAYITSLDKNIYAIDLADGITNVQDRLLWSFTAEGAISATPLVQDGKLYVGDLRNNFYSLDIATRERAGTGDAIDSSTEWIFDANGWVWAEAVIEGNVVYVANLGGEMYAVSIATGQAIWSNSAKIEGQIVAAPAIYDGPSRPSDGKRERLLAVPSGDGDVWVIDTITGQDLGKFATTSGVKSSPVVSGSTLYVHTLEGELQWFSTNDRARLGCLKIGNGEDCR